MEIKTELSINDTGKISCSDEGGDTKVTSCKEEHGSKHGDNDSENARVSVTIDKKRVIRSVRRGLGGHDRGCVYTRDYPNPTLFF